MTCDKPDKTESPPPNYDSTQCDVLDEMLASRIAEGDFSAGALLPVLDELQALTHTPREPLHGAQWRFNQLYAQGLGDPALLALTGASHRYLCVLKSRSRKQRRQT
jgi:hypothetical protein